VTTDVAGHPQPPDDLLNGHTLGPMQTADLRPVLHKQHPPRSARRGVNFPRRYGVGLEEPSTHGMLAYMTGMGIAGYGDLLSWEASHGESYLQAITGRFNGPVLYLLDEAEGPLSFQSTLLLLHHLREVVAMHNAQVIYSTHSPLVSALPGAQILQLSEDGIHEQDWSDLEAVRLWQAFLRRRAGGRTVRPCWWGCAARR